MMAPAIGILKHRLLMSKTSRLLSFHFATFSTCRVYLYIKMQIARSNSFEKMRENLQIDTFMYELNLILIALSCTFFINILYLKSIDHPTPFQSAHVIL